MKTIFKVALVQSELVWEDPVENRRVFQQLMEKIKEDTDLVIFPEMFTTGFTMNAEGVAEEMNGETVQWMKNMAVHYGMALMGSVVIREGEKYYNRALFVHPSGETEGYDKRHTFTLAGEHKVYARGKEHRIVEYKGWKVSLQVCYDLRFPVWARNTQGYDVLVYVANWPEPRIGAWDTLLKARAIENMCYCVGVNRIGRDGEGHIYPGHSGVYDVLGERLAYSEKKEVLYMELHREHIEKNRRRFKFLQDRDGFVLD